MGKALDVPDGAAAVRAVGKPTDADVTAAATLDVTAVLAALGTGPGGLTPTEVNRRRAEYGPNAVRTHHARALGVLGHQLRSALLVLLLVTAVVSYLLGEHTEALIIGTILAASIGLGFANEYRAERAAEALHSSMRHLVTAIRDGAPVELDVTELVPGDVVLLQLGAVVPADIRLLEVSGLECEESVLTGESEPAAKDPAPVPAGTALAELTSCALMGTVVRAGSGRGVVVATGGRAEFGRIALGLGERQPETEFQVGLRRFSMLLLQVAVALTALILVANLALHRPLLDSVLFSLAIAVGITPQLLPAVVSSGLAAGSRALARRRVLVKRLVCIEDLGDVDVLLTDKTGTLTEGRIGFLAALDAAGDPSERVLLLGLLATEGERGVGGNALDAALWAAPGAATAAVPAYRRLGVRPFDHDRRLTSSLVDGPDGPRVVVKGAPEAVLACCRSVPDELRLQLDAQFAAGSRVVAVATKPLTTALSPGPAWEKDLDAAGLLVFHDPPKADAPASLHALAELGITVKVATGDNPQVARKVCTDLGLPLGGILTGADVERLDDTALADAVADATIFARVSPAQKARVVRLLRSRGRAVAFLGDGVNDALALHAADVGISVDTATDVAKDAADVLLLEKSLGVLAGGVAEGRRVFANTMKYVLMGTSSNFGNMFSAAAASSLLPFLPMLPSQILLNNLLYDTGQLSIPTDRIDDEQRRAPAHWDIGSIRRFMFVFGPISSLFDFLTFAIMFGLFHAGAELFRTGWFIESLATQSLVIFAIRTRRVPFLRSRPSGALLAATLAVVAVGVVLPFSPLGPLLGFTPLPAVFFLVLIALVVIYLVLIEVTKKSFYAAAGHVPRAGGERRRGHPHRLARRAGRFSQAGPLPVTIRRPGGPGTGGARRAGRGTPAR